MDEKKVGATGSDEASAVISTILTRRSVRAFTEEPVSEEDIDTILECAMAAPSAIDEQPWDFVVIDEKDVLEKVGAINRYAAFAPAAPLAILVCLNKDKEKIPEMSVLDMGMCSENIMLAARALDLGSVFTGIYPMADRIKGFSELVDLPENVVPMGLIVIGHPKRKEERTAPGRFKRENVHRRKWGAR